MKELQRTDRVEVCSSNHNNQDQDYENINKRKDFGGREIDNDSDYDTYDNGDS